MQLKSANHFGHFDTSKDDVEISAALLIEAPVLPVVLGCNHNAGSAVP